jgi:hypothetical protein
VSISPPFRRACRMQDRVKVVCRDQPRADDFVAGSWSARIHRRIVDSDTPRAFAVWRYNRKLWIAGLIGGAAYLPR